MQKLFLGICYLLISQTVISQQISGRVTDAATGTAVAAATVALGTNTVTLTNDSGYFEFRQTRQRDYRLSVSSVGYRTASQQVTPGSSGINISLQPINLMMQPVEVRALRAGDKAPFTKTNISKA